VSSLTEEFIERLIGYLTHVTALLEEMVLFRTRSGSIPRFIYGTPK